MAKMKKIQVESIKSKPEERDILTEMFEHFGIEVIDVKSQVSKPNKKRN